MVYEIRFNKKSKQFLKKLEKSDKKRIANKLKRIRVNPKKF